MKIVKPSVKLIWMTPNSEALVEEAGRTCYKSEGNSGDDFVRMLLRRGHESVLEHSVASFRVVCDRGISHELVRHRLASYSQESTRFCNYSQGRFGASISVIEPPGLSPEQLKLWRSVCEKIESAYMFLVVAGVLPQIARSVLPTCLKTEIVITANFREWRHILQLRTSTAAHPQIREIAHMILSVFREKAPVFVEGVCNCDFCERNEK